MNIEKIAPASDERIIQLLLIAQQSHNATESWSTPTLLSVLKRFTQVAEELDARRGAMSRIFEALGGPADVDAISKINGLKKDRDGWHGVVQDVEGVLKLSGTAKCPGMSNLPNLVRDYVVGMEYILTASGQERGTPRTVVDGIEHMRQTIEKQTAELKDWRENAVELLNQCPPALCMTVSASDRTKSGLLQSLCVTWAKMIRQISPPDTAGAVDGFMECAACAAKPGMPALCQSCLTNRSTIERLQAEIRNLTAKCENQRQRIVHLEGATNHVGGTPLTIASKKLDESKHQNDNLVVTVVSLERECDKLRDSLRAAQQETAAARAEVKEYKSYTNALHEIAKSFLPLCPEKCRAMMDLAIGKGKALADACRRKLIGERDNDWATALQPMTSSYSMSPETASARVGIAIKEAKVRLLKDLAAQTPAETSVITRGWLRHQAEKLQRGDVLSWESAPPSAVVPDPQASEKAGGSPVPPQEAEGKWVVRKLR